MTSGGGSPSVPGPDAATAVAGGPGEAGDPGDGGDVAGPLGAAGASRGGRVGRPRGPRRSRDERRSELLDAAERAIRRIGPQASMDELAAEAGITKPILYSHFGDKAGLASALAERVAAQLGSTITSSLGDASDPRRAVSSTIGAFYTFIESEQALYRFLVQTTITQSDRTARSRLIAGFSNEIAAVLADGLRLAGGDEAAAVPWSYAIVGMTLGTGEWWLHTQTMSRDELVDHLSRLLWGGLAGAGFDSLIGQPLRPPPGGP